MSAKCADQKRSKRDAVPVDDLFERSRLRQNGRRHRPEGNGGIRCVHPVHRPERQFQGRSPAAAEHDGDHGAGARRQDADHGRAVRRNARAAWRLLPDRGQGSRRRAGDRRAHSRRQVRFGRGPADLGLQLTPATRERFQAKEAPGLDPGVDTATESNSAMTPGEVETIFRNEAGRALATLIRRVGDFDLAEDAMQEAFAVGLERWPAGPPPSNPRAWLVNVGRNKAIDRVRRQIAFRGKRKELARELLLAASCADDASDDLTLDDDMLRLIFICCHPAFAMEVQVALTLRTVCGLGTAQVARAFLVSEDAMAQRLVRARQKIRLAGIPDEGPDRDTLGPRLRGVLAVIYLVFTESDSATSGDDLIRPSLAREAIRLGRLLAALMPQRGEIKGLLALMLLHDARRASRATTGGDVVLLEEQDRALWDHAQIAEGVRLVEEALRMPARPQSYAVQAAIAALHARAPNYRDTDWPQIAGLYEVLLRISPSPVIELNHAAAISMVDGPARALDLIDALETRGGLDGYELMPAVRADLLRRLRPLKAPPQAHPSPTPPHPLHPLRRLYARRLAELDCEKVK